MGARLLMLWSKARSRVKREGLRTAFRHYIATVKFLVHQIAYDRWLDHLEQRPTGQRYIVREDEVFGPLPSPEERLYQAFPRLPLLWSIKVLDIDPTTYTFIDYGSGRGRVILTAAAIPFKRVIGVEFARSLHADACVNIAHYPRDKFSCPDIVSLNLNAIDFDLPAGNVIAFFFNPFSQDILDRVADRIEDACRTAPRSFYVIFANTNRMRLFVDRPRFRQVIPHSIRWLGLALLSPVPIEIFRVTTDLRS